MLLLLRSLLAPNTKALTATSTVSASLVVTKIPAAVGALITANTPRLVVEIDFTNDPTSAIRTWTEVTSDVRALTYTRSGRSTELQRTTAGTLSAVLSNTAAKYDPTNTTGPFYPGVKRMRWIRVRAVWAGVTYDRWRGLIETWNQSWPEAGADATVQITATDTFKVLNLFDLNGISYPAQRTDQRVAAVLASAGITSTSLATGQTSIVAADPFSQGSSALAHLLEVEASENGLLYAEGDGTVVFQDRYYRILHSGTSVATIGENAGEIPYREGELDLADDDIWNEVSVTPAGGVAQLAADLASQAANYKRRLNQDSLSADTNEALAAAQYLVGRYGDPSPRLPTVELLGAAYTAKWPIILAAKNSDRFTWKRRASAHTISLDVFVERVSDTVIPGSEWQVKFELSPATDQTYWLLGDAVYGVLDTTTTLAY